MEPTEDTRIHLTLSRAYSRSAQKYRELTCITDRWELTRHFVDMAMQHWRQIEWKKI